MCNYYITSHFLNIPFVCFNVANFLFNLSQVSLPINASELLVVSLFCSSLHIFVDIVYFIMAYVPCTVSVTSFSFEHFLRLVSLITCYSRRASPFIPHLVYPIAPGLQQYNLLSYVIRLSFFFLMWAGYHAAAAVVVVVVVVWRFGFLYVLLSASLKHTFQFSQNSSSSWNIWPSVTSLHLFLYFNYKYFSLCDDFQTFRCLTILFMWKSVTKECAGRKIRFHWTSTDYRPKSAAA